MSGPQGPDQAQPWPGQDQPSSDPSNQPPAWQQPTPGQDQPRPMRRPGSRLLTRRSSIPPTSSPVSSPTRRRSNIRRPSSSASSRPPTTASRPIRSTGSRANTGAAWPVRAAARSVWPIRPVPRARGGGGLQAINGRDRRCDRPAGRADRRGRGRAGLLEAGLLLSPPSSTSTRLSPVSSRS